VIDGIITGWIIKHPAWEPSNWVNTGYGGRIELPFEENVAATKEIVGDGSWADPKK
jgi:hypothetical protein